MLGIHKESHTAAISVELEASEPPEWGSITPTQRGQAGPKAGRPPMLELPGVLLCCPFVRSALGRLSVSAACLPFGSLLLAFL